MTARKISRRPGAAKASADELAARLGALEDRVARLEAGRPPPGDGRNAARRPRDVRRCPGCGLPLRVVRRRCASCGRPVDADARPRRPSR